MPEKAKVMAEIILVAQESLKRQTAASRIGTGALDSVGLAVAVGRLGLFWLADFMIQIPSMSSCGL